jgi:hypothetical protein
MGGPGATPPTPQELLTQLGYKQPNIRQDPFFSNEAMQKNKWLGALSGAMTGAMNVPAAPEVSGAGSGISRALAGGASVVPFRQAFQEQQEMRGSTEETIMIIGDRLRAIREQKKFSQGDIEKRTGLLRCYISRSKTATRCRRLRHSRRWPGR